MKMVPFDMSITIPKGFRNEGQVLEVKGETQETESEQEASEYITAHPKLSLKTLVDQHLEKLARAAKRQMELLPYQPITETPQEMADKQYYMLLRSGMKEERARAIANEVLAEATAAAAALAASKPATDTVPAEEVTEEVPATEALAPAGVSPEALSAAIAEAEAATTPALPEVKLTKAQRRALAQGK